MPTTSSRLALLALGLAVLMPAASGAVGSFGTIITSTTTGVVGRLNAFTNTPAIGFLDNNPTDGNPGSGEALILSFGGDATVHQNDIILSNPSGSLISGSAGAVITTAPSGAFVTTAAPLRFVDALPVYAQGGPDGNFGPGEGLFIDLDASGGPSAADRVLVTGTGVSGSVGGVPSTQTETVWDSASECIYVSTDAAVQALSDTLVSADTGTCPDGTALATVSGIKITGADALYNAGEDAYFASGATVTNGAYRITTTAGGAAGSMVSCGVFGADPDCGTALFGTAPTNTKVTMGSEVFTPAMTDIRFFDANGNAVYDSNDRVVLDVDSDQFVTPPDVRMSSTGGQIYGSRPTLGSLETRAILDVEPISGTIIWLDGATNPGQVDSAEPIALHLAGGPLALALGDICWTTVGGCPAGTQRSGTTTAPTTGGSWADVSTATNPGVLSYMDSNNNNVYNSGDSLYLHFGTLPANVAAGDLLVASDSGGAGTKVTTAGGSLKALPFAVTYGALDVDGGGTYSYGDIAYIDRNVDGFAAPGDIRLNSGTGVSGYGKNLRDTDADAVNVLMNPGAAADPFAYRDIDGSTTFTQQDPIFLLPRATGCPLTGADVVLSGGTGSGFASGAFVAGAANTVCTAIGLGSDFGYQPIGVYNTAATVYFDADGDGNLEQGDAIVAGSGAGTRYTGATVVLTPLIVGNTLGVRPGAVSIRVVDASGDGIAAAQETVLLDVDGDNLLTPGDIPLSGTGTSGTGGGGGGGGGGGNPNPVPSSSSSSSSSTSNTTSNTTTSSSASTSSSSASASPASEASLNQQIQASLEVKREDGDNVLTWDDVTGESGYQVFGSESPFVLLASLPAGTTEYRDEGASASRSYLVTACVDSCTLTAADVNSGDVPGYTGVPEGEHRDGGGSKGWIPGPSPVLVIGLLALAALAVRRRTK
ncbi:MAG TPA: hypothetical protein VM327_09530 [Candidatus Thermoplasmatota archaeon]|nr:hypothetical protein [Candidatus Thermoplasmatota archaeon]